MPLGHASRGEDKESRMELGLSETIASHFCASARRLLVASKTLGAKWRHVGDVTNCASCS
jgi:hypothetical protein